MLLVIDVGNTNIVLGVFKGKELLDHWRISTNKLRTTDEYGVLIRDLFYLNDVNSEDIDSIIISSVVPPVMPTLERMCQRYFGLVPLIIGPGVKTGMDIKYDNPREVGADRIVKISIAMLLRQLLVHLISDIAGEECHHMILIPEAEWNGCIAYPLRSYP